VKANNQLQQRLFAEAVPKVLKSQVKVRKPAKSFDDALLELPQILEWMALATANGCNIYECIWQVAQIGTGQLATNFKEVVSRLEFGSSLQDALENMRDKSRSLAVSDFVNSLLMTLERGTPVADSLAQQAQTCRSELRNQLLIKAGSNEIKLLLPLVFLILPVTIWFAIFPSFELLNLGF
jgi:tight adherence protein C